jgi:hypothetical protein
MRTRWLGVFLTHWPYPMKGAAVTFLVCLVAFAGRLDQTCGLILAGAERFTLRVDLAGQE